MKQTSFITPYQSVNTSLTFSEQIEPYLNLITSQHRTKPNFMTWLSSALAKGYDGLSAANNINSAFDIDSASGIQLDVIGQIVGRNRSLPFQPGDGSSPTLSDSNYQIALKAKIAQNQWDGTIPTIYNIWNSLFSDIVINIVDNQNMTMSVLIDTNGTIDPVITEMLAAGYIVPKPAGIGLTIIEVSKVSENQYAGGWVTANEVITLTDRNTMVYQHNYIGAMVTTHEIQTLAQ